MLLTLEFLVTDKPLGTPMTMTYFSKTRALAAAMIAMAALSAGCSGSISTGGASSVDQAELETGVATELEKVVGQTPASVTCEGDLPAEVDAEVRCTVTADDGSEVGATVTVDEVDGTNVNYSVQVDG